MTGHMAMRQVGEEVQTDPLQPRESITTFEKLRPGDEFCFRIDLGIWLVCKAKPTLYDKKRGRYALQTREHGLAFANEGCRVWVKPR